MKIIKTQKYAKTRSPKMDILKENKVSLTEEEKKEIKDRGAVWDSDGSLGVWKSVIDGKEWFTCHTHRAYQSRPTLKGAINAFEFIKTTS